MTGKIPGETERKKLCWLPIFHLKTEKELSEMIFCGVETEKKLPDPKPQEHELEDD
jgi:hypothetical protein